MIKNFGNPKDWSCRQHQISSKSRSGAEIAKQLGQVRARVAALLSILVLGPEHPALSTSP